MNKKILVMLLLEKLTLKQPKISPHFYNSLILQRITFVMLKIIEESFIHNFKSMHVRL